MIRKMLDTEVAWCAGLFEGEGSIFQANQKRNGMMYSYLRATIKMTDLDVLEKFHKFVGAGTITHQTDKCKEQQPAHHKRHYYWQLTNREDLGDLMLLFWEYLGERRKAKIIEIGLLGFEK